MKTDNIGLIILGFFVLIVLVVGGLYIYHISRYNYIHTKEGTKVLQITNKTPIHHEIYHSNSDIPIDIAPNESKDVHINYFEHISSVGEHQGIKLENEYQLTNDRVDRLYLTLDGFRTNMSASHDVSIVNESKYPVSFIQTSIRGGSKWHIVTLGPYSKSIDHFVGHRSLIYVAYASAPHLPVAETHISDNHLTKITFDGEKILME